MDRRSQYDFRRSGHPQASCHRLSHEPNDATQFPPDLGRVVRSDPANANDQGRVYFAADPRLVEMAREITSEVDLLPPPMIIEMDPTRQRHVRVRDDNEPRVEFEVLGTSGEQGGIFDTSGSLADAALVNRARQFISVHKLTGTDAESLALLARQRPALLAQLLECGEDNK